MTANAKEVVVEFGSKVRNSYYSKTQCNGHYELKTSAIRDLLNVAEIKDSPGETAINVVKFVRGKMNKSTTKWYAGELAMALNWFGLQFFGLEYGGNWSKLYFQMFNEYIDWVYNKSDNDEMIEFVYWFIN